MIVAPLSYRYTDRNVTSRRGFTILELLVAVGVIALLIGIAAPALQRAREAARRTTCTSNLRQMAVASEAFLVSQRRYPDYLPGNADGVSGHAQLLPYLEQNPLSAQVDLKARGGPAVEPPTFADNPDLLRAHVPVFVCPSDDVPTGGNSYRACFGTTPGIHATWTPGRPRPSAGSSVSLWGVFVGARSDAQVTDGLSHTAFFSERLVGDGSTTSFAAWRDVAVSGGHNYYPEDAVTSCAGADASLHFSYSGWTWLLTGYGQTWYNHILPPNNAIPDCVDVWLSTTLGQGAISARSLHPGGVHVALGDGAVRFVNESIDLSLWRGMASIHGAEVLDGSF